MQRPTLEVMAFDRLLRYTLKTRSVMAASHGSSQLLEDATCNADLEAELLQILNCQFTRLGEAVSKP